jgi:hypothetical protein
VVRRFYFTGHASPHPPLAHVTFFRRERRLFLLCTSLIAKARKRRASPVVGDEKKTGQN